MKGSHHRHGSASLRHDSAPHSQADRHPQGQRRVYHRYCARCGWGFSFGAWQAARFCPRCGHAVPRARIAAASGEHREAAASASGKTRRASKPRPHESLKSPMGAKVLSPEVIHARPTSLAPAAPPPAGLPGFIAIARENPMLSSTSAVALGVGLILAAPPLVACALALASLGQSVAVLSTVLGLFAGYIGARGGSPSMIRAGLSLFLGGTLVAAVITFLAGLVGALAGLLGGIGWVLMAAGGIPLLWRASAMLPAVKARLACLSSKSSPSLEGPPPVDSATPWCGTLERQAMPRPRESPLR